MDQRRTELTRQGSERSGSVERTDERRSSGDWTGYVVPYRYYGPGYRGVGYYSVMYQGPGQSEDEEREFDQSGVRYGQGQGAGAGWQGGTDRSEREAWQQGWGSSWRGRGGFSGRGPKGYQRSDERIREEVCDRLMADDWIDASDIEVTVEQGEVKLAGIVRDRQAKRRAEDVAEDVMGVRDVMNEVRVEDRRGTADRPTETGSRRSTTARSSSEQPTGNGRRRATAGTR
jgi:osmotically-inducible protein OsmY